MKITINYDSSWRNSFLDGDNNEPVPKKGRKYIASITELGKDRDTKTHISKNFLARKVTKNTVMGALNRLIGDQRKLYQSRKDKNYYFADIEDKVRYNDIPKLTQEMTYLRNISGSTDQNSFTGAIKSNDPMFNSDYSQEFWGVLALNLDELMDFILNQDFLVDKNIQLNPVSIVNITEELNNIKPINNVGVVSKVVDKLNNIFPEVVMEKIPTPYIEKNGKVKPIRFYAASLYIQQKRLQSKFNMDSAISKRGKISGFSKRGYNGKRDYMKAFTTGKPKKIWGNPYIHETFVKGEGKTRNLMTKASGKLEITIAVSREKAKEMRNMIYDAGVSSFYLGKKGLAFVDGDISIKEV